MKRLIRDPFRSMLMILLIACAAMLAGLGLTVHLFSEQQVKAVDESVVTLAVRQMDPAGGKLANGKSLWHTRLIECVNAFPGIRVPVLMEAYTALANDFAPLTSGYPDPEKFSYVIDEERAYTVLTVTCLTEPEYPWAADYPGNRQWQVRVRVDAVHATAEGYTGEFAIEDEILVEGGRSSRAGDANIPLEAGRQYLVRGVYEGRGYTLDFDASFIKGYYDPVYVKKSRHEYTPRLVLHGWWESQNGVQYTAAPDDAQWLEHAVKLAEDNNRGLRLFLTGDLRSIQWFHSGRAYLTSGRSFTKNELDSGARVCIISQELAAYNGLSVGDTISLSAYEAQMQVSTSAHRDSHSERFAFIDTMEQVGADATYEIIGLYSAPLWRTAHAVEGTQDFCQNTIFAPYGSVTAPAAVPDNPYYRGFSRPLALQNVILQNGQGEAFIQHLADNGYPEELYTIEEKNYPEVQKSVALMQSDSRLLLAASVAVGLLLFLIVLALYARAWRRENAALAMLGAGKGRIALRMMASLMLLTLVGCALALGLVTAVKGRIEDVLSSIYITPGMRFSAIRVGAFSADGLTIGKEHMVMAIALVCGAFLLIALLQALLSALRKPQKSLFD